MQGARRGRGELGGDSIWQILLCTQGTHTCLSLLLLPLASSALPQSQCPKSRVCPRGSALGAVPKEGQTSCSRSCCSSWQHQTQPGDIPTVQLLFSQPFLFPVYPRDCPDKHRVTAQRDEEPTGSWGQWHRQQDWRALSGVSGVSHHPAGPLKRGTSLLKSCIIASHQSLLLPPQSSYSSSTGGDWAGHNRCNPCVPTGSCSGGSSALGDVLAPERGHRVPR